VAEGYDRMILISDDSFPLKPIAKMLQTMGPDDQYIGAPAAPDSWIMERYSKFYHLDSSATNPRAAVSDSGKFRIEEISTIKDLTALMERGKKSNTRLFHGKQWWSLTKGAAEYVLKVHEDDDHLRESFRFSAIPDEQYIQTIVGNASYKWNHRTAFMWTDFSRHPKPYVFRAVAELEDAFSSDHLFVRKVSEDADLLNYLKLCILDQE